MNIYDAIVIGSGQALESAPTPQATDVKPDEALLFLDSDREVDLAARNLFG